MVYTEPTEHSASFMEPSTPKYKVKEAVKPM